jgi:chemotaxis protein MotA
VRSPIFGILGAIIISYYAIVSTSENKLIFINIQSIVIVLGGSICAAIITFGVKDLRNLFTAFFTVFFQSLVKPQQVVAELIAFSQKATQNPSILKNKAAHQNLHPFATDGLGLIANDFTQDQVESIMTSALMERKNKLLHQVEIMKTLSKYPPAFGMIGTVVGLIGILQGLGSTAGVNSIGPNMAVALITTLYGLFLANYVFIPFGDHLLHRLENEIRFRKIVIRGVMLLHEGQDPAFIQEMLNSHLLPAERVKIV